MKYTLADLLDVPQLQELMDAFFAATRTLGAILDIDGTILVASGWQDICTKFHRGCSISEARCHESDAFINRCLDQGKSSVAYECANGLVDVAHPIIVEGNHLGNVFTGQFLYEKPQLERFQQQAQEFGFDETAYLQALAQVPIIPREKIEPTLRYLTLFTQVLANAGLERLKMLRMQETLRENEERFRAIADYTYDWESWLGPNKSVQWINPAVERLTGYSVAECLAMADYPLPLIYPADQQQVITKLYEAFEGLAGSETIFRIQRKEGRILWAQMSWQPIYNGQGEPLGCRLSIHDIDARKQAEEEQKVLQARVVEVQRMALCEIGTPLIPLAEGVVAMPLIGTFDAERAQQMMAALLEGVATHRARIAILDFTGVPALDSQTANNILQAVQAVRLLGAQVILTGIRAALAQTLIQLGLNLDGLITCSTLQAGIAYALKK
jgi:PAS domain S-box-containing protein